MSFWRPGTVAPGSSIDRDAESSSAGGSSASVTVTGRVDNIAVSERRTRLPITKQRESLLYLLEEHAVVVLQSPTGTGKSTQLPQFLLEAGWAEGGRTIGITQPRRVAAISVAQRVAQEVGCILGDEVGYNIRFESLSTPDTKILYLTDGMLFREILVDPLLSRYSVIMVDEAHERSLYTDLLLGVLKKIRRVRPSLRIIISSATINAVDFVNFFNVQPPSSSSASSGIKASEDDLALPPAKKSRWDKLERAKKDDAVMVRLEGRVFPVEISYLDDATANVVRTAVETIFDIHLKQPAGDILVFLTGREEIDRCMQEIADNLPRHSYILTPALSPLLQDPSLITSLPPPIYHDRLPNGAMDLLPLALHSGLSVESQMAVFDPAPPRTRKVIISTNVAEASITIEGIKYVVDSGLVKLRCFNPLTGMDSLITTPCSLASLAQRSGRAGRTSPGKCFRLFPSSLLASLLPTTPPELTRSDLSLLILQLKSLGIQNVLRFDWMTAPSASMVERGLEFLFCLGALDEEGKLTKGLGVRMAEMPVDPMMAKILLDSYKFGCSEEILSIAAMTSVQNVFLLDGDTGSVKGELERRKFIAEEGDHLTALNVYNAFVTVGRKSSKWCHTHRLNFRALSRALSIRTQLRKYLLRWEIPLVSCSSTSSSSRARDSAWGTRGKEEKHDGDGDGDGDGEEETEEDREGEERIRRCLTSGYFRNAAKINADGTYTSLREGTILHPHPSSILFNRAPKSSQYVIYHEVMETTKRFMREMTVVSEEWFVELAPHYYSFKSSNRHPI